MGTKMKGVLKGLRYITQIFEDEKESELQIGCPTDVKHVAHIGWDGPSPSVDNSPSWMKEYKADERPQTANDKGKENQHIEQGSRDADSSTQRGSGPQTDPTRDLPDVPKSSRRNSLAEGSSSSSSPSTVSLKGSNKTRQSRKNSSDSSKSTRKHKDPIGPPGSNSSSSGTIPKKSSRKKSKEGGEICPISQMKAAPPLLDSYTSPFSDPGPDIHDTRTVCDRNTFLQSSSLMRLSVKEEEKR